MNVCERWFCASPFQCFEQCVDSKQSSDKEVISLLRGELQETIVELNAMMGRLERVTAELKEMTIDKEMYTRLNISVLEHTTYGGYAIGTDVNITNNAFTMVD
jgi:hypothetical protein